MIERVFQVIAVVLAGAAAYFLWIDNGDYAFVSVVLACIAFFLSIRFQVKERNRAREAEYAGNDDHSETGDDEEFARQEFQNDSLDRGGDGEQDSQP